MRNIVSQHSLGQERGAPACTSFKIPSEYLSSCEMINDPDQTLNGMTTTELNINQTLNFYLADLNKLSNQVNPSISTPPPPPQTFQLHRSVSTLISFLFFFFVFLMSDLTAFSVYRGR